MDFQQIITFLTLALFSCSPGFIFGPDTPHSAPIVDTTCGRVNGVWKEEAYSFQGIPYAKAPVGNLRWQPPEPLSQSDGSCWTGTLMASKYGNFCVQRSTLNDSLVIGDEDCLFLNVWTPSVNSSANLPVMVFIHGGSLQYGTGNGGAYGASEQLAKDTGVVYVSMNYRLQVFGFMALEILAQTSSTGTSGNYGFMDQILALKWVQSNIRKFGGNPNQVTLAGHSSGSLSVLALLGSPLSKGLFQRAWLQSGSPRLDRPASSAFQDNLVFLNNTRCSSAACLKALSPKDLTLAVPWDTYPFWAMPDDVDLPTPEVIVGAMAIVDGYVLPEAPFEAWIHGNGVDVPLLIGSTGQEVSFKPTPPDIMTWDWDDYQRIVTKKLSKFSDFIAKMALKLYPPQVVTPEYQYTSMVTDLRMGCGNDYLALIASSINNSTVYRSVTTYGHVQPAANFTIDKGPPRYAFHGIDIFSFFNNFETLIQPVTKDDRIFTRNIQTEVLSFIKTGRPYTATWRPFPETTAIISVSTTVTRRYHWEQCLFWMTNGFWKYSWIN